LATLSSPTAQNLLTDVRTQLNQRDPTNSFWTDAELLGYLNDAVSVYFLEAAQANEGYFTTTSDLNIVSGTDTIALPADCFQVKRVLKKVTDGYVACDYRNTMTQGIATQGGSNSNSFIPAYYFRGNSLVLDPVPQFSETGGIRLEYIQFPDQMIYGGDSLTAQVSPIFKQLITMFAVYRAKLRESMVNGVNMYQVPADALAGLVPLYRDSLPKRSKGPTFVQPFNPESE
jgi:hypothetical protein